ncbi:trithorax group protein osa-like isoform X2 [Stegodyphus dumicola]|uniref:trithorax group protein osa-like isoform X2 n=1 Tax=Stegodyphus dumicola TaxID=202533 RepID=UPI0015AF2537|nr:trithorax group protein osa-like isoform X2 [Stegodyphus dumicola]
MATPAHARMACPEQKTPESGDQEGSESLKNGTSLEDSDDSTGNVLVKNRVRSPAGSAAGNQQHRDMTMDNFQDGGTAPQPNSRPASANLEGSFPASMDRSRLDYQAFNQSTNRDNEDFRNSQENYNHGGSGCDLSYGRGSYASGGDQHGGQGNTSDMTTNSQSNKMYPQYNQPQMRPGYSQAPRSINMGPQQRSPGPAMGGGYPGGNNSQQQRFLSGPSLSQQTGPTPTLNQLLQAPNSLQRYHNNYDYSASQGLHKNMGDPNTSQYQGPNSSWGNMRGSSGYPQQMSSSIYRNQGGPMPDPSMKRPYMSPNQLSSPAAAAPSQGQYPHQYHPYSQTQPQGAPVRPINQNYPQQSVQQYSNMQQQQHGPSQSSQMSPAGGYDHQRQPQMGSYGGPPAAPPAQPAQQQQQNQPASQQQPPPPQSSQQQQPMQQQQTPPSHQQPPPHTPPSQQQQQQQQHIPPPPPSSQQQQQQQQPQQQQQQVTQQPSQKCWNIKKKKI